MKLAREHAVFEKDRLVTTSDGTPIAYTVVGDGDKVPIVFLNGWTCSDAYWAGIGPGVVEAGHRAVFLDTRGHGQSGLPRDPGPFARRLKDEDVSVTRVATDMVEVLDDAGIDKAVFSGHSMGVQAIFELYDIAPDRVAALVPMAGTFENPVKTFADKAYLDRIYPVADVIFRWVPFEVLRPVIKRTSGPNLGPKIGHRVVRAIKVAGPKVTQEDITPHIAQISEINFSVLWRMMSGLREHSTADVLPKVTVPTLVVAGRRDLFTPPSVQQKMADLIPDSEIVWFEDGGHMLPIEEPEEIVKALTEFLARRLDKAA